ncbi:hypothetical protein BD779DRAFT_1477491 [Infundibulicybe gibba]|nr:hypothetical protein BD779DRAFT_1477491 [Infundibulicybe gibba]
MLSVQAGGGWRNVGRGRCGSTESNGDMWRGRDRTRERRTSEGGEAAVAAGEQWWQKLRLVIRGTSCKHGCGRWAFKRSTFQRSALMDLPEKRHPEPAACLAYAASRLCRLLSLAVHTLAHPECCKAYYPPANIPYAVTVTKRRRFNTSPHPPRRPGALTGGERRRGRLPARLKHTSRRRRFRDAARPTSTPGIRDQHKSDKRASPRPASQFPRHPSLTDSARYDNRLAPSCQYHLSLALAWMQRLYAIYITSSPSRYPRLQRLYAIYITSSPSRYPEAAPDVPNRPPSLSLPASRRYNGVAAPRDYRTTT